MQTRTGATFAHSDSEANRFHQCICGATQRSSGKRLHSCCASPLAGPERTSQHRSDAAPIRKNAPPLSLTLGFIYTIWYTPMSCLVVASLPKLHSLPRQHFCQVVGCAVAQTPAIALRYSNGMGKSESAVGADQTHGSQCYFGQLHASRRPQTPEGRFIVQAAGSDEPVPVPRTPADSRQHQACRVLKSASKRRWYSHCTPTCQDWPSLVSVPYRAIIVLLLLLKSWFARHWPPQEVGNQFKY